MAVNPNISKQSPSQITKRIFDTDNDAIRTTILDANNIEIALDQTDEVTTFRGQNIQTGTLLSSNVANDVLVTADCNGFSTFCLYSEGLTGVTVAGSVKVQVSPYTSGTQFIDTGVTLTSGVANSLNMSAITNLCARRIRLVVVTAPTGGNATYSLIMNG